MWVIGWLHCCRLYADKYITLLQCLNKYLCQVGHMPSFWKCPGRCFWVHSSTVLVQSWYHRIVCVHKDSRGVRKYKWKPIFSWIQICIISSDRDRLFYAKFECIIDELARKHQLHCRKILCSYGSFGGTHKNMHKNQGNLRFRECHIQVSLYFQNITWL